MGYDEVARLLAADGKLVVEPGALPDGSEELALAVVRSAMKTMLVTRTVWRGELGKLQDLELGLETFPAARSVQVQPVRSVAEVPRRQVRSIRAVRAYGTARADLGIAAETELSYGKRTVTLRWALTPQLRVLRVASLHAEEAAEEDARLRAACSELAGRSLAEPGSGPLSAIAREITHILEKARPREDRRE
jgi:hypothetical protein